MKSSTFTEIWINFLLNTPHSENKRRRSNNDDELWLFLTYSIEQQIKEVMFNKYYSEVFLTTWIIQ